MYGTRVSGRSYAQNVGPNFLLRFKLKSMLDVTCTILLYTYEVYSCRMSPWPGLMFKLFLVRHMTVFGYRVLHSLTTRLARFATGIISALYYSNVDIDDDRQDHLRGPGSYGCLITAGVSLEIYGACLATSDLAILGYKLRDRNALIIVFGGRAYITCESRISPRRHDVPARVP